MFVGLLVAGSVVITVIIAVSKSRSTWTGGFPYAVLASAIPAWGITVLVGIQGWDLIQIRRHGAMFQIADPDERALPRKWLLQLWLPLLIAAVGFLIGQKFW